MATKYGTNATKRLNQTILDLVEQSEYNGRLHVHYDEYVFAGDLAVNDIIKMGGMLPAGARVITSLVDSPDLDTASAGAITYGWADSPDVDSAGTTLVAAVANGFNTSMDVHTAGLAQTSDTLLASAAVGKFKKFAGKVQPQIKITGETDATTGTIRAAILYTFD
jgi:hypothetical protein